MAHKRQEEYVLSEELFNKYYASLDDLADRINLFNAQLTTANIEDMISEFRQKLDKWRTDCYNSIDRFYEKKCRELDQHTTKIVDEQRKELNRIRSHTAILVHKRDISYKNIDHMTTMTRQIEQDMDKIKEIYLHITTRSLEINDNSIEIQEAINASKTLFI